MTLLLDAIAHHASLNSAAPALIGQQGSVTYGELSDFVVKIANFLDDRRLPPLTRAFINVREPELRLIVTLAAVECGLVPAFAAPELLQRDFPYSAVIGSRVPMRPDIVSDLVIDESVLTGRLADGRRRTFAERGASDLSYVTEMITPDSGLALIGVPAAAHRASWAEADKGHLRPGDRMMFAMGSISRHGQTAAERALAAGAGVVTAPGDALGCLKLMTLFEVIDLQTTPFAIGKMIEAMERQNLKVPSVRYITLTGSAFEPSFLKRVEAQFDAEVSVAYGTSEAGPIASGVVSPQTYRRGYVGHLRPGITVRRGGTAESPLPVAVSVAADHLAQPILRNGAVGLDASSVLLPDVGYTDGDTLVLTGRMDELLVADGRRVPYELIRRATAATTGVTDVGVVSAAPLGKSDEVIVAVVAQSPLDLVPLGERVAKDLNWPQAPDRIRFFQVPDLPHNPLGAIDRGEVLRQYSASHRG